MAAALAYLQDNGLTDYEQLAQKASEASERFHSFSEQLKSTEADIELYRAACADFRRILGGGKLPKMAALKAEGHRLTEQRIELYGQYRRAKEEMREVTTVKVNIDYLLGYAGSGRKKEQER